MSSALVARLTGALILLMAVGGFTGFGSRAALIVFEDASVTAERISASRQLFQLAFFGDLLAFLTDVPVTVFLYWLVRAASPTMALVAAGFRLVYTAVVGASLLNQLGAGLVLSGADYLSSFDNGQRQALALLFLSLQEHGYKLALVFTWWFLACCSSSRVVFPSPLAFSLRLEVLPIWQIVFRFLCLQPFTQALRRFFPFR